MTVVKRKPVSAAEEVPADETPTQPIKPSWPELTDYEIEQCRQVARGLPIFKYENAGLTMVFRPLRALEWAMVTQQETQDSGFSQDEKIARAAVIWPPQLGDQFWANALAGHAPSISLQVQEQSGFPMIRPDGTVFQASAVVTLLGEKEEPVVPTEEELETLRSAGQMLHLLDFAKLGRTIIIRPLIRSEYHEIQSTMQQSLDTPLRACEKATVWPKDLLWGDQPAGIVDFVFETVLEASGFNTKPLVQQL